MADEIQIIINGDDRGAENALHRVNRAMGSLEGGTGGLSGALSRMGEVAGGVLLAGGLQSLGRAVGGMVKEAFEATASYERLGLALENLSKRDFMAAGAIEQLVKVGTTQVEVSAANAAEIEKLTARRDVMVAKMQEEAEHHRQLIERWGAEGLAVKTHAAEMAEDQLAIDNVNAKLAELGSTMSRTVDVYERSTTNLISEAEASEMAAKASEELVQWVEQLAIKSPFTEEGVAKAFRPASAYGFVSDQALDLQVRTGKITEANREAEVSSQRLTQALIDFASGSGADAFQMDRIALALGQIKARGKLAGQEVRQLTEAGLSVYPILSEAFGKSTAEIIAMQEKGLIPADQAIQAIVKSIEEDFGGAALRQSTSFAGLVSTLSDVKTIGLREFFTGTFEALQPYLNQFASWLQSMIPSLSAFGEKMGSAVAGGISAFASFFSVLAPFLTYLKDTIVTGDAFNDWLTKLPEPVAAVALGFGLLLAAISNVAQQFFLFLSSLAATFGESFSSISLSLGSLLLLLDTILGPALLKTQGLWTSVWTTIQSLILYVTTTVGSLISEFLNLVGTGIMMHAGQISAAFNQAGSAISSIVSTVIAAISAIIRLVLGEILLYVQTNSAQLRDWFGQTFTTIALTVGQAFETIRSIIASVLSIVIGSVQGNLENIRSIFWSVFDRIQQIITTVLNAVSTIITAVLSNVKTFIERHGDDIRSFLGQTWQAIGEIIDLALQLIQATVVPALQAIARWIQEHGDQIQAILDFSWSLIKNVIGGTLDIIKGILKMALAILKGDWSGAWEIFRSTADSVGKKIQAIVDSFLNLVKTLFGNAITDLETKIRNWTTGLETKIRDTMSKLSETVNQKLGEVKQWFTDRISEIMGWIRGLPGDFRTLGQQVVDGLIQGLRDKANDAIQFIKDLCGDVIGWAKAVLGIKSPSTVFSSIAVQIIMGLIQGLQSQTPELVQALGNTLTAVFTGINTALAAFANLVAMSPITDLQAKLDMLVSYIMTTVQTFKVLAEFFANNPWHISAKAVLDPLSEIFSKLSMVIQGLQATLGLGSGPDLIAKIEALVPVFLRAIPLLVGAMEQASSQFTTEALLAAQVFAGAAESILAPVKSLVTAFEALATWSQTSIDPSVRLFMETLHRLIKLWIIESRIFEDDALLAAIHYAEAAKALVDPITSMVAAFTALAAWVPTAIDLPLSTFFQVMYRLTKVWIDTGARFEEQMLVGALAFADTAARLVAPIVSMKNAFEAMTSWSRDPILDLESFLQVMQRLAQAWIDASNLFDQGALPAAVALAGKVGQLVAPLAGIVAAFKAVASYVPERISPLVDILFRQLLEVAKKFANSVFFFDEAMLVAAVRFAGVASQIVGPLKLMVDQFTAVAAYVPERLGPVIETLAYQLWGVAGTMAQVGLLFSAEIIAAAVRFATTAGQIVSPLKSMVEAFTAVTDYEVTGIGSKLYDLVGQLGVFLSAMTGLALKFRPSDLEAVAAFATSAGVILSPVKAMVEGFQAVAQYVRPGKLLPFGQLIVDLGLYLKEMTRVASDFNPTELAAAAAFAKDVVTLIAPVKAMVEAFTSVVGYRSGPERDVLLPFGQLVADLSSFITAFLTISGTFDMVLIEEAAALASKISTLIGWIKPALDSLTALSTYVSETGLGAKALALSQDISEVGFNILTGFSSGSLTLGQSLDDAVTLSQKVGQLTSFIRGSVDSLKALTTYVTDLEIAQKALSFGRDIVEVSGILFRALRESSLISESLLDDAVTLGTQMGRLVGFIKPGIEGLVALATYSRANSLAATALVFGEDLALVSYRIYVGIRDGSLALGTSLDDAVALGERISQLVGFIRPGIDALVALSAYVTSSRLLTASSDFISDILQLATTIATGLGSATPEFIAALAQARVLTDQLQGLTGFIRPTIEALRELHDYQRPYGFGTGMITLMTDISTVIGWMVTASTSMGPEALTAARTFGEIISAIIGSLLEVFAGIAQIGGQSASFQSGLLLGQNWIDGLIQGLTSRMPDLVALMEYIRGLFPSSPAKYGPFRSLPQGSSIAESFGASLATSLQDQLGSVTSSMSQLYGAMSLSASGAARPTTVINQNTQITFGGTWNVRSDRDAYLVATQLEDMLARKADVAQRMNVSWSTSS